MVVFDRMCNTQKLFVIEPTQRGRRTSTLMFWFLIFIYSTCFEPEGLSSGRRLHIQVWYGVFYMHQYKQSCR